jgi:hypothetical protein
MRQIKSFGVLQTAKVMGALYFFLGVFVVVLVFLAASTRSAHFHRSLLMMVLAPVFYGIAGFIFTAAICWLYNAIARRIGGIEFEASDGH